MSVKWRFFSSTSSDVSGDKVNTRKGNIAVITINFDLRKVRQIYEKFVLNESLIMRHCRFFSLIIFRLIRILDAMPSFDNNYQCNWILWVSMGMVFDYLVEYQGSNQDEFLNSTSLGLFSSWNLWKFWKIAHKLSRSSC